MFDAHAELAKISSDFDDIRLSLHEEEKKSTLTSLQAKSVDEDLWGDPNSARKLMQDIAFIQDELTELKDLGEEIEILKTLVDDPNLGVELEKCRARIQKLKTKTYLSGINDKRQATLSIHAGQGGTEAMDWTAMLSRMYLRFCERRGWKTSVLDETPGEEAGTKSIVIRVEGPMAYGYLKRESGTHRLVRQSPFNADNLRQTSFALVEVLPEFEDIDLPDIEVKDEDLDIQFYRSGGHGGQNVNKVSTAVRLKHIPTGLTVSAQSERFQEQNRKIAMGLLKAKLWARKQEEAAKNLKEIKGEYRPASWGTQIRSYVLHPYKMVKDLRTGVETSNTVAVLDGEIDEFIEADLKL